MMCSAGYPSGISETKKVPEKYNYSPDTIYSNTVIHKRILILYGVSIADWQNDFKDFIYNNRGNSVRQPAIRLTPFMCIL